MLNLRFATCYIIKRSLIWGKVFCTWFFNNAWNGDALNCWSMSIYLGPIPPILIFPYYRGIVLFWLIIYCVIITINRVSWIFFRGFSIMMGCMYVCVVFKPGPGNGCIFSLSHHNNMLKRLHYFAAYTIPWGLFGRFTIMHERYWIFIHPQYFLRSSWSPWLSNPDHDSLYYRFRDRTVRDTLM